MYREMAIITHHGYLPISRSNQEVIGFKGYLRGWQDSFRRERCEAHVHYTITHLRLTIKKAKHNATNPSYIAVYNEDFPGTSNR